MVDCPTKEEHEELVERVQTLTSALAALIRKTTWLQQELNYCRLGSGLTELKPYVEVEDGHTL